MPDLRGDVEADDNVFRTMLLCFGFCCRKRLESERGYASDRLTTKPANNRGKTLRTCYMAWKPRVARIDARNRGRDP
jgi:hypothetical protein